MIGLGHTCKKLVRAAVLGAAAFCGAGLSAGAAEQIEVIVDRGTRGIEIFLGMPARTAITRFGLNAEFLTGPGGAVDFADFSGGTWDIGDHLLAGVDVRIGKAEAGFEATSLMVHLKDQRLPFLTPIDGLTAISVCGVAQPAIPPTLDDLYLYAGFVAYPPDALAPLRFTLPQAPGEALSVTLREYGPGHAGTPRRLQLAPGEPLILGTQGRSFFGVAILAVVALIAVVALRGFRRV
ncbi:hypothetical protein [Antarctobacter heliothermus]|uniref:Uncharacterized protein n=1 Tax=Antarctobacter heliothermus TaxID=74033 RepID=A0A239GBQ7_9RHOB|nr:hypothetical protein [Antarctobacter heliothermus]SNS66550.1 hypothetical protein SAMN04488078_102540 [Antarctobacter heliothermus]